jgi:CubicO group peptidase (beta-lactamase class C family)
MNRSLVATPLERFGIQGHVNPGFEAVREAFAENFVRRGELGGACCALLHGEKVVDLWGGIRNKESGEPWERDTMVVVHSATKGLAAMTLAIAHSRGWLDYGERVCAYWPEFAQNGKDQITVRQLLAHQAGLFALHEPVVVRRGSAVGRKGSGRGRGQGRAEGHAAILIQPATTQRHCFLDRPCSSFLALAVL